jgi:hypothetical protein
VEEEKLPKISYLCQPFQINAAGKCSIGTTGPQTTEIASKVGISESAKSTESTMGQERLYRYLK